MTRLARPRGAAAVLVLLLALALTAVTSAQMIGYVTPTAGSVAGGTYLTIVGNGFSEYNGDFTSSNGVIVGGAPCRVLPYYTTSTRVVCETAPSAPAEGVPVTVIVDGKESSVATLFSAFSYREGNTPALSSIEPQAGSFGDPVSLRGSNLSIRDVNDIIGLYAGEGRFGLFNASSGAPYTEMPTWDKLAATAGPSPAGSYNLTLQVARQYGNAQPARNEFLMDGQARLYTFQVYPAITGLSAPAASVRGGLSLTVRGSGFSPVPADNEVTAGGLPCDVTFSTYDHVVCTTRAGAAFVAGAGELFPGSRGVRFRGWTGVSGGLSALKADRRFPASPNVSRLLPAAFEAPRDWGVNTGQLIEAYFTAPMDAVYTFFQSSDDASELWAGPSPANLTRAARVDTWTAPRTYASSPAQASPKMALKKGERLFLRSLQQQGSGGSNQDVAVRVGAPLYTNAQAANAVDERQRVYLRGAPRNDVQTITIANGTANGTVQLALGPLTATVPGNASAAEVKAAVESLVFAMDRTDGGLLQPPDLLFRDSFEAGGAWQRRSGAATAAADDTTAYAGSVSMRVEGGASVRAFEREMNLRPGMTSAGYDTNLYPLVCMAYRIPASTRANMLVQISGQGWRSLEMTMPIDPTSSFPPVASWNVIADNQWHYTCIDLDRILDARFGAGQRFVQSIVLAGDGVSEPAGAFWIDEFSVSGYVPEWVQSVSVARRAAGPATFAYDVSLRTCAPAADISASALSGPAPLAASAARNQSAEAGLSGTFTLAMPGLANATEPLAWDAPAADVRAALLAVGLRASVLRWGSCYGLNYDVTFDGTPGDLPLLEVDASGLSAPSGAVTATATERASGGFMLGPIPGEFLSTVEPAPQVTVRVNGLLAACKMDDCTFTLSDEATPSVASVAPAAGFAGDNVTVSGDFKGLNDTRDAAVAIGGVACAAVARASPSSLECTVPALPAGEHDVAVTVAGFGAASSSAKFNSTLSATSVSPAAGGTLGGARLTVSGAGLGPLGNATASVTVGGAECPVLSSAYGSLVCAAPALAEGAHDVVVAVGGQSATLAAAFAADGAATPSVASISPAACGPFGDVATFTVTGALLAADAEVAIGGVPCAVDAASATASSLVCSVARALYGGDLPLSILLPAAGRASGAVSVAVGTEIASASPASGSVLGGGAVTFAGRGFPVDPATFASVELVSAAGGSVACAPLSSAAGAFVCRPAAAPNASEPFLVASVAFGNVSVALPAPAYTFDPAATPTITGVLPPAAGIGATVTIAGGNFSQAVGAPTVQLGAAPCAVTSVADDSIVCVAGESLPGPAAVSVVFAGTGAASGAASFEYAAEVTGLSSAAASLAGGLALRLGLAGSVKLAGPVSAAVVELTPASGPAIACAMTALAAGEVACTMPAVGAAAAGAYAISSVAGAAVVCSDAATACTVTIAAETTPQISSVSPASGANGDVLTISGFFPTGALSVSIGTAPCAVESSSNESIACTLGLGVAGAFPVVILVETVGLAAQPEPATSFGYALSVTSLGLPVFDGTFRNAGSTNGGAVLHINGTGFGPNASAVDVTVGGRACPVLAAAYTSLTCTLPSGSAGAAPVQVAVNGVSVAGPAFQYSANYTPAVTSVKPSSGFSGVSITIIGTYGNDSSWSLSDIAVTVGASSCTPTAATTVAISCTLSAGRAGPSQRVSVLFADRGYATVAPTTRFTVPLSVFAIAPATSSFAGGQSVTIDGNGFDPAAHNATGVTICGAPCRVTSSSYTSLVCVTGRVSSNTTGACRIVVSVFNSPEAAAVNATFTNVTFAYSAASTPTVVSVTPNRGSTAGGTVITLTGTGLLSAAGAAPNVTLAGGTVCDVQSATETEVVCVTRASSHGMPMAPAVLVAGKGLADASATYAFADLWSRRTTWGGAAPPADGDSVVILAHQTVLLDCSPAKLRLLLIEGSLIFDDQGDYELRAEWIMLRGHHARLQIGTEGKPYQHKATVTLYGTPLSYEIPKYGAKVIAQRGGVLDFHGTPRLPWTQLAATVWPGDANITLKEPVDWEVGGRVAVASSSFDGDAESEERAIVAVSEDRRTVVLDRPLNYRHLGVIDMFGGKTIDMRAEVAYLTRNVLVRGDPESTLAFRFGATMLIHSMASMGMASTTRMDNVEFFDVGQAFTLGRYAIHFHMMGDTTQSYVRSCAIHRSWNRAVAVHGVNRLRVTRNVAYRIEGHAYFLEDGVERENVIDQNLIITNIPSFSMLNTDQQPAGFWIVHPTNYITNNVAVGSDWGFWYQLLGAPDGAFLGNTEICPKCAPLGEFRNNTAHSSGRYGFRIFPEFYPSTVPFVRNRPAPAVFHNFTTYANGRNGFTATAVSWVTFRDMILVDNKRFGFEVTGVHPGEDGWIDMAFGGTLGRGNHRNSFENISRAEDIVVVGSSQYNPTRGEGRVGVWTPKSYGFTISNVTFVNFEGEGDAVFEPGAKAHSRQGGFNTWVEKLKFENVYWYARYAWQDVGIVTDVDGTLTGTPGGQILMPTPHTLALPECSHPPGWRSAVCTGAPFRRVHINGIAPSALDFKFLLVTDLGTNATLQVPWDKYNEFGWVFLAKVGRRYSLQWDFQGTGAPLARAYVDPEDFNLHASLWHPNETMYLQFDFTSAPDHVHVRRTLRGVAATRTEMAGTPLAELLSSPGAGAFNYTRSPSSWTLAVGCVNDSSPTWLATPVHMCPDSGCPAPPSVPEAPGNDTWFRWSDPKSWPERNFTVPRAGEDVLIESWRRMVLDTATPGLNRVTVRGWLRFDESVSNTTLSLVARNVLVTATGRLTIGNATRPFLNRAEIVLTGSRFAPNDWALSNTLNLGTKGLAVFGRLEAHGIPPLKSWTRLDGDAMPGATQVVVDGPLARLNDTIAIAAADWDANQWDRAVVVGVRLNGTRQTLTLDRPLRHRHFGTLQTITRADGRVLTLDTRAEVAVLTRNVVIRGSDPSPVSVLEEQFGAHVLVGRYDEPRASGGPLVGVGRAVFDSVAFESFGQDGLDRSGVMFRNLGAAAEGAAVVRRCAFGLGYSPALSIRASAGVVLEENVAFDSIGPVFVMEETATRARIVGNVAIATRYQARTAKDNRRKMAAFSLEATDLAGSVIAGNAVGGSERGGFKYAGVQCGPSSGQAPVFRNNTAHSALVGVILVENTEPCARVSDFTVWKSWDYGIYVNILGASFLEVDRVNLVDNKQGMLITLGRGREVQFRNSAVVGHTAQRDCALRPPAYRPVESHEHSDPTVGVFVASFPTVLKDEDWPAGGVKEPPSPLGEAFFSNVLFANFGPAFDSCGVASWGMTNNNKSGDRCVAHTFSGIELANVSREDFVRFGPPAPPDEDTCGNMHCDAAKKCLFRDADGTLTGFRGGSVITSHQAFSDDWLRLDVAAAAAGDMSRPLQVPWARWNPAQPVEGIARKDCLLVPAGNAYWCLGPELNHQQVVFASQDADSLTRRIGPVGVYVDDALDVINGPSFFGWCMGYRCRTKPSTFFTVIPAGRRANVSFTGTMPDVMTVSQLTGTASDSMVVSLLYMRAHRIDVFVRGAGAGAGAAVASVFVPMNASVPRLTDPVGSNHFDFVARRLHLVVRGGGAVVTLRVVPVVKVSLTVEMPTEQFLNSGTASFVQGLAFMLNIDPLRIRVVSVVAGTSRRSLLAGESTVDVHILPEGYSEQTPPATTDEVPVGSAALNGTDAAASANATGPAAGGGGGNGTCTVDDIVMGANCTTAAEELYGELAQLAALIAAKTESGNFSALLAQAANMTVRDVLVETPPPPPAPRSVSDEPAEPEAAPAQPTPAPTPAAAAAAEGAAPSPAPSAQPAAAQPSPTPAAGAEETSAPASAPTPQPISLTLRIAVASADVCNDFIASNSPAAIAASLVESLGRGAGQLSVGAVRCGSILIDVAIAAAAGGSAPAPASLFESLAARVSAGTLRLGGLTVSGVSNVAGYSYSAPAPPASSDPLAPVAGGQSGAGAGSGPATNTAQQPVAGGSGAQQQQQQQQQQPAGASGVNQAAVVAGIVVGAVAAALVVGLSAYGIRRTLVRRSRSRVAGIDLDQPDGDGDGGPVEFTNLRALGAGAGAFARADSAVYHIGPARGQSDRPTAHPEIPTLSAMPPALDDGDGGGSVVISAVVASPTSFLNMHTGPHGRHGHGGHGHGHHAVAPTQAHLAALAEEAAAAAAVVADEGDTSGHWREVQVVRKQPALSRQSSVTSNPGASTSARFRKLSNGPKS
eukprot:tig00020876_g14844.t1